MFLVVGIFSAGRVAGEGLRQLLEPFPDVLNTVFQDTKSPTGH